MALIFSWADSASDPPSRKAPARQASDRWQVTVRNEEGNVRVTKLPASNSEDETRKSHNTNLPWHHPPNGSPWKDDVSDNGDAGGGEQYAPALASAGADRSHSGRTNATHRGWCAARAFNRRIVLSRE